MYSLPKNFFTDIRLELVRINSKKYLCGNKYYFGTVLYINSKPKKLVSFKVLIALFGSLRA